MLFRPFYETIGNWLGLIGGLIQPILLFELFWQVFLRQILKVLIGEGVEFVFEAACEHPFDFLLPRFFLEPGVGEEFFGVGYRFRSPDIPSIRLDHAPDCSAT